MPRILGVDPGTRVVGYGVIDCEGSSIRHVAAGAIRVPASLPIEQRLARIAAGLRAVVAGHAPESAAMEDVFVDADPRSALKIGFGRGAILAVLGEAGLAVASYAPATVKKAIAANGRADKSQVSRMITAILGLEAPPEPVDVADALAVAVTHALRAR